MRRTRRSVVVAVAALAAVAGCSGSDGAVAPAGTAPGTIAPSDVGATRPATRSGDATGSEFENPGTLGSPTKVMVPFTLFTSVVREGRWDRARPFLSERCATVWPSDAALRDGVGEHDQPYIPFDSIELRETPTGTTLSFEWDGRPTSQSWVRAGDGSWRFDACP